MLTPTNHIVISLYGVQVAVGTYTHQPYCYFTVWYYKSLSVLTPTNHIVISLYGTISRCRYLHPPTILLFHCMLLQVAVGTYTHQPYCYFIICYYKSLSVLTPTNHIVTSLYVTISRCRYLHPPTILLLHYMLLQVAVGTYTHQPYCYFTVCYYKSLSVLTPTNHIVISLYGTISRCRYLHPPTILLFHCMVLQVAVGTYTHQPYCYFTVWYYKSLSVLTPTNHIVISLYVTTSRCRYLHPPTILLFHCMVLQVAVGAYTHQPYCYFIICYYKSLSVLTPTSHIVIPLYGTTSRCRYLHPPTILLFHCMVL